jgi:TPR repeat protein
MAEEGKGQNDPEGTQADFAEKGRTNGPLAALGNSLRNFAERARASLTNSGSAGRLLLIAVAGIAGAFALLWVVDKIVSYYFARSYVEEIADAFDLNKHLTDALVLLTFFAGVLLARCVWSFSRQKRRIGIVGLASLFLAHSLVLWYATKNNYFDRAGNATKCYVLSRDGRVTYGERIGTDPTTGRPCRSFTAETLERLKEYEAGKRPREVTETNPTFFDPRSGEPIVWYYKDKDDTIQLFDLMGFHPVTGDELISITKDVVAQWKSQIEQRQKRAPKLIDPDKYVFFDPRTGDPRAWYWISNGGHYEFYDGPGYQPQTGDKLQVATRDIVEDWENKQKNPETPNRPPNKVEITTNTVFFDPVTGNPLLWYWRRDSGEYDFFDGPGFHPQNGDTLKPFTKDALTQYRSELDAKAKRLQEEKDRVEREQKERQQAEDRRRLEQQQRDEAEQRQRQEQLQRATEAARQCDQLAANPSDAHRVGEGVPYAALKPVAAQAVEACDLAAKQNPTELRFQYQLGRALELAGDGAVRMQNRQRAMAIHQKLVNMGYAAACDNLGSLYRWDKKDMTTAVAMFRRGVQLGDADSMVSLADMIGDNEITPGPNETSLELYKRAADLGNPSAMRAYQDALTKAQNAQQQQIQQIQQQQMMLQFLGAVLQNVR